MAMFMGTYTYALDAKGRLVIPPKFREQLGDSFVLTVGTDNNLVIYDIDSWTELAERLIKTPKMSDPDIRRFIYNMAGSAFTMETDKQGRVLIPTTLLNYAGLKKDVVFKGAIDSITIWDSEAFNEFMKDYDPLASAAALRDFNL